MKPILYLSTANKKGIYQLDRYIEAEREEKDRLVRIQPFSFINPSK
jgi:hypothetical protein